MRQRRLRGDVRRCSARRRPARREAFISADLGHRGTGQKSGYNFTLGAGAGSAAGPNDCNGTATITAWLRDGRAADVRHDGHACVRGERGQHDLAEPTGTAPTEPFTASATVDADSVTVTAAYRGSDVRRRRWAHGRSSGAPCWSQAAARLSLIVSRPWYIIASHVFPHPLADSGVRPCRPRRSRPPRPGSTTGSLTDPTYISPCDINATFNCTQVYLSRYGSVARRAGRARRRDLVRPRRRSRRRSPAGRRATKRGRRRYLFALVGRRPGRRPLSGIRSFFVLKTGCLLCIGTYVCVVAIFILSRFTRRESMTRLPARLSATSRLVSRPADAGRRPSCFWPAPPRSSRSSRKEGAHGRARRQRRRRAARR